MKVAFYCRAPYKGNLTIFEQEQLLLDYINSRPEASLYAIYVDHQSKEDLERRIAFSQLLYDAGNHVFHTLICLNSEILSLNDEEVFPTPILYVES